MTSTNLLYIYVIIINVVTFFIYGLDKSRAKAGQWRIPEARLIFLAVIGGSVGALAANQSVKSCVSKADILSAFFFCPNKIDCYRE